MCCFFVWSPSPKVGTQSLSSHCVDHITPSATRHALHKMCVTWCASTSHAVEKTRKCSWSSLRILVAVASSSLLARCLDCCSLLDGHQRWFTHRCHGPVSQFSLTTFPTHSTSCSSVRQVSHSVMMQRLFFTCIGILLPSVHGGWTRCPLKVLVYRCHSTCKGSHHVVLRDTLNGSVSLVRNLFTVGGRLAAHFCT